MKFLTSRSFFCDILPEQFLSVVNRYKFIEDVRESNLMIVYDKDKEEYIYRFLQNQHKKLL